MKPRTRLAAFLLALAFALAFAHTHAQESPTSPRKVVVFIGDGMGVAHVTLGRLGAEQLERPYAFDRFRTIGFASTRSANNVVTDSSAAATALSAGYKTNNGFLGVDPEKRPRRTLLEIARNKGLATGLVTTTRITHATPAAYAAHVDDRNLEAKIADQYLEEGVDVLLGGGRRFVTDKHLEQLRAKGYVTVTDAASFRAAKPEGKLVGVFTQEHLSYEVDRDSSREPSLREMTEKALDLLSSGGRGFVLMVEGGRIDHAGHVHDAATILRDQLAFSDAIDAALERVERQGDLLVLATADHTTGGLAISERLDVKGLLAAKVSMEELMKAHRPGELLENLAVFKKTLEENFGVSATEKDLELARRGGEAYAIVHMAHLVSQKRGVGFYDLDFQHFDQPATHGHEGSLVPVYAAGAGAASFAGTYENTRIALELARLLGLPAPGALISDKRFH